jgi:hypothetical protein
MTKVMIIAAKLIDPEAWASMTKEQEGRLLRQVLAVVMGLMELRGHEVPADVPLLLEPLESVDVYVDPEPEQEEQEEEQEADKEEEAEEEKAEEEGQVEEQEVADGDAVPAAAPLQLLHPTHMIKFGYQWWPVYENAFGFYVLREYAGKLKRVYVHHMAASTQATLKPVAAQPSPEVISACKVTPTGTFLLKGGVFHAVFQGSNNSSMYFVEGQAEAVGSGEPVVLQLSEHDRAALSAANEE